jgi:heme-degrading monooxygenase HmoA
MHAVVVNVAIDQPEADLAMLRNEVVPRISQVPGFVTGYWTRKGDTGLSMIVFDSEDAANAGAERVRSTLKKVEVREVVAHA